MYVHGLLVFIKSLGQPNTIIQHHGEEHAKYKIVIHVAKCSLLKLHYTVLNKNILSPSKLASFLLNP